MPPPPCHPQSGPSQSGDLETRVAGDVVVSAKTPSPPNGKDPQLDLRNSPRGPSPNLSPALALSPRFKAPGARPFLEGALRGGRSTTPPVWPLGGQDPGERRAFFFFFFPPPGSPLLPAPSETGFPGGSGAAGLERLDGAPTLRAAPSPHPPTPAGAAPTHPATRRHRLRREGGAAAARGGRGGRRGGRGAGGGTARETPRGVRPEPLPWGGSPFLPFPSRPGAGGAVRLTPPPPLPGRGNGMPSLPWPPHEGAPAGGGGQRSPSPQHLDSGSPSGVGGVSAQRPLSEPGTNRDAPPAFLPHPYLGSELHVAPRAESGAWAVR